MLSVVDAKRPCSAQLHWLQKFDGTDYLVYTTLQYRCTRLFVTIPNHLQRDMLASRGFEPIYCGV